jgi:hypothetical protein
MSTGNVMGKVVTPTTSSASGVWSVAEHYWFKSTWPGTLPVGLIINWDAANYPGSGTTLPDTSGNNLNATLSNSPTYSSSNGGYFTYNGSNTALIRADSTTMNSSSITVETWAYPTSTGQYGTFLEKGSQNTQYFLFLYGGTFYWRVAGLTDTTFTAASYMTDNTWHHIVGTATSGSQKVYVNNVVRATTTTTGTISTNANGMSVGISGGFPANGGLCFSGRIAVSRVYNRVLTDAEIASNWNSGKSRFGLT